MYPLMACIPCVSACNMIAVFSNLDKSLFFWYAEAFVSCCFFIFFSLISSPDRLKSLKFKTVEGGLKFAFVPSEDDYKNADKMVENFINLM